MLASHYERLTKQALGYTNKCIKTQYLAGEAMRNLLTFMLLSWFKKIVCSTKIMNVLCK